MFPFGTLNNQNFSSFVLNNKNSNANTGSSINLKPPPNLSLLFNQFNDLSSDSVNKNPEKNFFDDPEYLIKTTNQAFDVIAVSESRIKSNMDVTTNIDLTNYSIEYTPTESHTGGTLLYISNRRHKHRLI